MAFVDQACSELLAEEAGTLLVMARGLGLQRVLRQLVEQHSAPQHLVFLLNASKEEEELLLHDMTMRGVAQQPALINNECSAQERIELYLGGGVLLVTARILIVDLLCERVPVEQATGIIVANAHRVSEGGNVAFILRVVRQRNKHAFIKALSDDACSLTNGFSKAEKVMRSLFARKLHVWPRFHMAAAAELDRTQPIVEELSVPLSRRELGLGLGLATEP